MSDDKGTPYNLLLAGLSADDRAALGTLENVELEVREIIETPGEPVPAVYFPRSGLISVVAYTGLEESIEVGMIGFEGMTGVSLLLDSDRAVNQMIVQSRVEASRLPVPVLRAAMAARPHLELTFRRYAQVFLAQISQTALANGRGLLSQRLARWLLMWHDRSRRLDLSVTHDFLGVLLGTRRATVTVSLHDLEGRGLIRAKRTTIEVLDRAGLEAAANGYYGVPEAEYSRLLGLDSRRTK
jgi:CRP-like cAMP-binding protein